MKNPELRINQLKDEINMWNKSYYELDNPVVSDLVWDAAMKELIQLEKENPQFSTEDSPTKQVGGSVVDDRFKKINHVEKMLSISNALNVEELIAFDKRVKKNLKMDDNFTYFCELKIDGLSIAIRYSGGKLINAITRGNGMIGEDVTHNVLQIPDIPKKIDFDGDIEVRGEIYMSKNRFDILNEGKSKFANPRNAAAGTLRQLDSGVVQRRGLNSFIYFIYDPLKHGLSTQSEVINFLTNKGFKTNDKAFTANDIDGVIDGIEDIVSSRNGLPYEIDGIVVKVNEIPLYNEIGKTIKFPKYMIAYKFPEEVGQTKLLGIFPTIGKTGKVTYNAKLTPIRLAGTIVSKSTLHNADYIKELNINVGDEVLVKKAGEIIPKVIGVSKKNNNDIWVETTMCPSCDLKLVRKNDKVDQYCKNIECPAILLAKLVHFVSRDCMNIEGLSEKKLAKLLETKLIKDSADIFSLHLHKDQLLLQGKKLSKSVDNLLESIEKAKNNATLSRFINSLNIEYVGEKISSVLAKKFKNISSLKIASQDKLDIIPEIGESISFSIIHWFSRKVNYNLIDKFTSLDINPIYETNYVSNILENKKVVITGKLSKSRKVYVEMIEANGGNVTGSVSTNTDYVLAGSDAGSKLDKAIEKNIRVLSEEEFMEIIKGDNYVG